MRTLKATHDLRQVAPWPGHASVQATELDVRAAPTATPEATDKDLPPELRRGRFRAPDKLNASLRPGKRR
jgi:hypothetical protein